MHRECKMLETCMVEREVKAGVGTVAGCEGFFLNPVDRSKAKSKVSERSMRYKYARFCDENRLRIAETEPKERGAHLTTAINFQD